VGGVAPLNPKANTVKVSFNKKDLDNQVLGLLATDYAEFKIGKALTQWRLDIGPANNTYFFNETFTGSYLNLMQYNISGLEPSEILQMPFAQKHPRAGGSRMWYPKMLTEHIVLDSGGGNNVVTTTFNHWLPNNILDDTKFAGLELILPGVGSVVTNSTGVYVPKFQVQTTVWIYVKGQLRQDPGS